MGGDASRRVIRREAQMTLGVVIVVVIAAIVSAVAELRWLSWVSRESDRDQDQG